MSTVVPCCGVGLRVAGVSTSSGAVVASGLAMESEVASPPVALLTLVRSSAGDVVGAMCERQTHRLFKSYLKDETSFNQNNPLAVIVTLIIYLVGQKLSKMFSIRKI